MTWLTLYLRADTEADLIEALADLRTDEGWITASHDHALDVIGTITRTERVRARLPDGTFAPDDPDTPDSNEAWETVTTTLPGYHANLRIREGHPLADTLAPLCVEPANPVRVWA